LTDQMQAIPDSLEFQGNLGLANKLLSHGRVDGGTMQRTILVVDDMDEVREMCSQYLAHEGFRVAVASNGQEAVDTTSKILPTLVLMDLSLPIMGGLEATKRIKGDPKTQHIPVILMTAQTRNGSAAVIEAGCEGFLVKPAAPREIVAEIERVLKRARSGQ